MDALIIVTLVLSCLSFIGITIFFILYLKKAKEAVIPPKDEALEKSIKDLNEKLIEIKAVLPTEVKGNISSEFINVMEKLGKNNDSYIEKLNSFQKEMNKSIDDRFEQINKRVNERLEGGFKDTNETFSKVIERLAKIDEAQKNIEGLSSQVVGLTDILQNNQSRGKFGEFQLSSILHNVFGDTHGCYEEQYQIKKSKNGEELRPDAVVFMPNPMKMVCIDSKFPFASYRELYETKDETKKETIKRDFRQAVKKHILTIRDKYIIEGETANYAIMFVPSDGVFAYINSELYEVVDFAREQGIIITSPSTLQPILATVNAVRINAERSKYLDVIADNLKKLNKDFSKFGEEWQQLFDRIDRVHNSTETFNKRVNSITNRFEKITVSEIGSSIDLEMLEDKENN